MHYDEPWEKAHEDEFRRERIALENRKQLAETLNVEEMVRIMFKDFLHNMSDYKVNELKREYIDEVQSPVTKAQDIAMELYGVMDKLTGRISK